MNQKLTKKWTRNRRRLAEVGRCIGTIKRKGPILRSELDFLLRETKLPIKVTLPGPMTVADSTADEHYRDEEKLAMDVAVALNEEALELEKQGAAVIQFDEPVFSRYPEKVVSWGIRALDRCAHICYSYPMPGVPRPIGDSYPVILEALEDSKVDQLALEFEASKLAPSLLRRCPSKTVLFGCIDNGTNAIENPRDVADKLLAAAEHLPPTQIQAAPDCGLVPLPLDIARLKLKDRACWTWW